MYNKDPEALDLKDFVIKDNTSSQKVTSETFMLGSDEYVVIGGSKDIADLWSIDESSFIRLNERIGNGLANSGDRLRLLDPNEKEIDSLSWGKDKDVFDPPLDLIKEGNSFDRVTPGVDTDSTSDFYENSLPSPGK